MADPQAEIPAFDAASILFHGHGLLAVDKPAGLAIHADANHPVGLAEMVNEWVRTNPGRLDIRSGKPVLPVQLLDRSASGVALFALRRRIAREIHACVESETIVRRFWAVVAGPVDARGHLRAKMRHRVKRVYTHRSAELTYRRVCGDERLSLVEVRPGKGRHHVIRYLFAHAGRPLAGDSRYGKLTPARKFTTRFHVGGLLLHCGEIQLPAEILGAPRTLRAPLPESFRSVLGEKGWLEEEPVQRLFS